MKKIVFLEAGNLGDDMDLERFRKLGDVTIYQQTSYEELPERVKDAEVLILNKIRMNEQTLSDARNLKLICVTATGTNNIDFEYMKKRGIEVRNAAGYSTETVVQHTFAMLFYLLEHLPYYDQYVKNGDYIQSESFTHFDRKFRDLSSMTFGVVGLGNIGRRVAVLAKAFGSRVIYYSTSGNHQDAEFERVEWDEFLAQSDVVSVHAPLNDATHHLFNEEAFRKMKPTAYFLNLGRGPIVEEQALYDALTKGWIAGAGLDVLSVEPMREDNPLYQLKDSDKLFITPHIAWASVEARTRLMDIVYDNVKRPLESSILDMLMELGEEEYAKFQRKLTPGIENVIGVRVPKLRTLAKKIKTLDQTEQFLDTLPHQYYDENMLHSVLLSLEKDYEKSVERVDKFLPFVDNWAVCDILSPKIFAKHKAELFEKIKEWVGSTETFTIRFGIEMLMTHFLDGDFSEEQFEIVVAVQSEEYYVRMMVAWYFATALAKQWEYAIKVLEGGRLDVWTHNKTIQKARESYRITGEQKEYLKGLKRV